MNKDNQHALINIKIILADDVCSMVNNQINFSSDLSANNSNLSMDYVGYFKQNPRIAKLLKLHINRNNLVHQHQKLNQSQLLNLIKHMLNSKKHFKSSAQFVNQSLF